MDTVQNKIIGQLAEIELEHRVKIPIAIESGSRAWGFASPDSDYDCRFIYVHPRNWYLSVFPGKDTIDYPPDKIFDVGGWDVRKVIIHLVKSNAVMLEWLSSGTVYRMHESVRQELWMLGEAFFNPVAVSWHYLSMARSKLAEIKAEKQSKIKKYCYVLRPLACIRFMQIHNRIPFMEYRQNLAEIAVEAAVREEIELLLEQKACTEEGHFIPQNLLLLDYFDKECAWAEQWLGTVRQQKNKDFSLVDATFQKIIEMVNGNG